MITTTIKPENLLSLIDIIIIMTRFNKLSKDYYLEYMERDYSQEHKEKCFSHHMIMFESFMSNNPLLFDYDEEIKHEEFKNRCDTIRELGIECMKYSPEDGETYYFSNNLLAPDDGSNRIGLFEVSVDDE